MSEGGDTSRARQGELSSNSMQVGETAHFRQTEIGQIVFPLNGKWAWAVKGLVDVEHLVLQGVSSGWIYPDRGLHCGIFCHCFCHIFKSIDKE
jgi:hypothetical protein